MIICLIVLTGVSIFLMSYANEIAQFVTGTKKAKNIKDYKVYNSKVYASKVSKPKKTPKERYGSTYGNGRIYYF